jgi:terminal uridylyltransferase
MDNAMADAANAPPQYGRRRANHSVGSVPTTYGDPCTPRFPGRPSPYQQNQYYSVEILARQAALLDHLSSDVVRGAEIGRDEIAEKESFRLSIQEICRRVIADFERKTGSNAEFDGTSVQLRCFGSLSSGFATKASDMDLGLLSPQSTVQPDAPGSPVPRLVEKAFLDAGLGARLLTRTRVPIIKLCEKPPENLLSDLRKEREKWEAGGDGEHGDAADDEEGDEGDEDHGVVHATSTLGREQSPQTHSSQDASPHSRCGILPVQVENQSLSSYFALAKRILRRLGGRDLTMSNQKDFSPDDFATLTTVCAAFVGGLHNAALRTRLLASPSTPVKQMLGPGFARTLVGVFTQVEGEAMLLEWELRKVRERSDESERQLGQTIKGWRLLCDKITSASEAIFHGKELQGQLDRMKRFRSVQLILLEQAQFESAGHYHERTIKIRDDVKPAAGFGQRHVEEEVVRRYISGICYASIRRAVEEFAGAEGGHCVVFEHVVVRHKSLQLALELERAQSHGLYPDADSHAIAAYVALLRGPLQAVSVGNGCSRLVVPIDLANSEHQQMLKRIRKLADPTSLAPNQPRDPYKDRLEFPKSGAGVQCDINFSAHLALHNTLLLRCYSHVDGRVRPLVLFVKHWAKVRGINTPYRGTLSSYGYVLMMLHYLVNVVQPFICPNLQQLGYNSQPAPGGVGAHGESISCRGRDVRFWRDEEAIIRLAASGRANQNRDSVGSLLRGFFEYYAHGGLLTTLAGRGFDWGREVLSLRTMGGLLTKHEKGWTGARTVTVVEQATAEPAGEEGAPVQVQNDPNKRATHMPHKSCEVKEVRHRYLFAIEDPFETDHNVARTVTHNGIVAIRDEFRRAWRIIQAAGQGRQPEEHLLQEAVTELPAASANEFTFMLDDLHGPPMAEAANHTAAA